MSRPIFIHSLFRTGSTYLWNLFRKNNKYICYYEPFHQYLLDVNTKNIDIILSRKHKEMHHPELDKYYWYEFTEFVKERENGIPFFKKEFVFDEFCTISQNDDLRKYCDTLQKRNESLSMK